MFLICSIKKNINFASSPRRRRIKCRERHRYSVSYVMLCGDTIYGKGVYHALCLLTA